VSNLPLLVVPAYNEASRLGDVLAAVAETGLGLEVIVVDDGSRDDTAGVARRFGATVLRHPFNLGYGAALQTGYKYALARGTALLVQMDADGQHDPREIERLIAPIRADEYDLMVGSRFLEDTGYEMQPLRRIGRQLFRGIVGLAGLRVSDPTSGFQAMNLRVLEVYARDFFPTDYPDVDVLLAAFREGLRVGECPVHMRPSARESALHGGLMQSVYYVYKMLLAIWSASKRPKTVRTP